MSYMFFSCKNIKSLDLSTFNTSSVTNLNLMFYECNNLISLNLRNWNTNSVVEMVGMFFNCQNLKFLDLSDFNTSAVIFFASMFSGCSNLIFLDLSNFNTLSTSNMNNMFNGCTNLISIDLTNFNTTSLNSLDKMFNGCKNLISLDLSNFILSSKSKFVSLLDDCNPNLKYCINDNNNSLLSYINSNYDFQENNCDDICFYKHKKIIFETKTCILNCEGIYKFEYNNLCFSSCPNGTHNITNNINNNICIDDNFKILNYTFDPIIQDNFFAIRNPELENNTVKLLNDIRKEFFIGNLDILLLNILEKENKDIIFVDKDIIYQFTSSNNQRNNNYTNLSSINFEECETRLRIYYNISNNISLIILKIDIFVKGFLIPIIEYEVYNSETKEKLNLKICEDIKIIINIPVEIDENNLFKYNSSNEYYNDICHIYTTMYKTDIILQDRRNEFIQNNLSLCVKKCEYIKYDLNTKKTVCECFIKKEFPLISEIEINNGILLKNFKDIKNYMNLNVMKCYYKLFRKEGLINNIGYYRFDNFINNYIMYFV